MEWNSNVLPCTDRYKKNLLACKCKKTMIKIRIIAITIAATRIHRYFGTQCTNYLEN